MANKIPNILNNVPTPFEVQDLSVRTLRKVLTIHIYKHFNTLQEQLTIEDYMVEKSDHSLHFWLLTCHWFQQSIATSLMHYLEKGIATHIMLYCQMGSLNPLVVSAVVIRE